MRAHLGAASSVKIVLPKARTVNYKHARDDGYCLFLPLITFKTASKALKKFTTANLLATKVIP